MEKAEAEVKQAGVAFGGDGQQLADLVVGADAVLQGEVDAGAVVVGEFEGAEAVVLVREVDAADRGAAPEGGEVLDEAVVAAGVPPAFDAPDVEAEFFGPAGFVGPDVAVPADAEGAGVGFRGADVERRGAVDGFFECGGDAREFDDVVSPLGADGGFAVAGGNAADDIFDESLVACRVTRGSNVKGGTAA